MSDSTEPQVPRINPDLIDTSNGRFKFTCPYCNNVHINYIQLQYEDNKKWEVLHETFICRLCPRHPDKPKFQINMFSGPKDQKIPAGPTGSIPQLPKYECTECYASGVYVGFTSIEPCSTCFPKTE